MNILITGVSGFIGSEIARFHLDRGDKVFGIDERPFPGSKNNSNLPKNLHVLNTDLSKDWNSVCANILADANFAMQVANKSIDKIYHCAAVVGVSQYRHSTLENSYFTNTLIDKNFLELIEFFPKAKIAYMSSSEVYGANHNPNHAFSETDELKMLKTPRGVYASEKYCMEQLLKNSRHTVYIFRLFNICGVNQRDGKGFLSNVVRSAILDSALDVYDGGTRCYCHVSDAVRMMHEVIEKTSEGGVFNIGNDKLRFSNIQLVHAAQTYFINTKMVVNNAGSFDEIGTRVPDMSKTLKYASAPKMTIENIFAEFKNR